MSGLDAFTPSATAPRTRARWPGPLLAVVVLGLAALAVGDPPSSGRLNDPTSTDAVGMKAVVDVLRALDVDVVVSDDPAAAEGRDTVLVPPLGWPPMVAEELAAAGRRVVAVVPPQEDAVPLELGVAGVGLVRLEVGDCRFLADVGTLRAAQWPGWQLAPTPPIPDEDRCVTRGGASWLVRVPVGDGELITLGSMLPFTNARMVDSDAAVAAVRLLVPSGTERVLVLSTPDAAGQVRLVDLIDRRWFDALWLSLLSLFVLVLARGRRLGRPVSEALPVRVPSGELARAIGDLRHRGGHDARAAASLRSHTLALARRRLGLPPDADGPAVVDALAASGRPVSPAVAAALEDRPGVDADGLVATARALAELRASLHVGPTGPADPTTHDHDPSEDAP